MNNLRIQPYKKFSNFKSLLVYYQRTYGFIAHTGVSKHIYFFLPLTPLLLINASKLKKTSKISKPEAELDFCWEVGEDCELLVPSEVLIVGPDESGVVVVRIVVVGELVVVGVVVSSAVTNSKYSEFQLPASSRA